MRPVAVIIAAAALVVGLIVGFFLGRVLLEHQWSQPMSAIDPKAASKAANDADPTPVAGTKVLGTLPIQRARMVLKDFTAKDIAVVPVAAFGADDTGFELHVVVENKGTCRITEVSGVAYGYDAWGHSAAANRGGEHYVAFSQKLEIAPGAKARLGQKMKYSQLATLALAHVDAYACADGTRWKRN